jgi:predicted hydrocarbon binding protein
MPVLNRIMQFITSKYLKFGEGEIWFGKKQIIIYFLSEMVNELYYGLRLFGTEYGASMFISAREEGNRFIKNNLISIKKILSPVVNLGCEVIGSFGYGQVRTIKVDEKENFMVLVGKSIIADEYKREHGASEYPIDFMLGGLWAGALEPFSQKRAYCVEVRCSAQKDVEECVWVVGSKDKIRDYVTQFAPESLDWANKFLDSVDKIGDPKWPK